MKQCSVQRRTPKLVQYVYVCARMNELFDHLHAIVAGRKMQRCCTPVVRIKAAVHRGVDVGASCDEPRDSILVVVHHGAVK